MYIISLIECLKTFSLYYGKYNKYELKYSNSTIAVQHFER